MSKPTNQINPIEVGNKLTKSLTDYEQEVKQVYFTLVLPNWGKKLHGFPQTLYGYMMVLFSKVDLLSAYWKGDPSSEKQSQRMIKFLGNYVSPNQEANSVAVQMWRHKLMHTGEPRYLFNEKTQKTYRWLLHWWEHLPVEQHYTFCDTSDSRILNLGLIYLISDLKKGLEKYLTDLFGSEELQNNFNKTQTELDSSKFRIQLLSRQEN